MGEVIVITSGKGGVGKTTTTANVGTGLAKLGKKVVGCLRNYMQRPKLHGWFCRHFQKIPPEWDNTNNCSN